MGDISRRGLLSAAAAAGAAALAACRRYPGPAALPLLPLGWHRGEERWIATTCGQCPAGCGIRVRVYEGRAVKIEGNADHPINRGGIGPKGQSGLQLLYHPDRIRGPLRREGPRGSGRWTSISWNEAVREVAGRLADLRARGEAPALVVIDGEPRGVVPRLWDRFLRAYGSPNHVRHDSVTGGAQALAMSFMQGVPEVPAYDWQHTEYVLGFGVPLFESWCQTIHMSRATGALRRGTPGRRVKFVHVSPHFSATAAKADEWVPIVPATEGALALGIAHVLVRDCLYDASFVNDRTFGFQAWTDAVGRRHRGFRDLVMDDYAPDRVQRITGVAVDVIERLAHEMSAHAPAVALGDGSATGATNGLGTAMAIHALNALAGSVERRGGVLAQRTAIAAWDSPVPDAIAATGLESTRIDGGGTRECPLGNGAIQAVPDAVLSDRPYPVRALILYRSNPVFSKPEGAKWVRAIQKVPFVISCSPLPDESTLWADLVLPDHTYLERWDVVEPAPSSGRPVVSFRQPVVPPRHSTLATGDLIIRIAKAVGGSVQEAFPWQDARTASADLLRGVPLPGKDDKEGQARVVASGAWAGEQSVEGRTDAFATPSGKFEFYSQIIASRLGAAFSSHQELQAHLDAQGIVTAAEDLCLPHWEPAHVTGSERDYPFLLAPYRSINYAEGGVRHLPWLREMPAAGLLAWKELVDVNPDDARQLGVEEGDEVTLETPAGKRRLSVRVNGGTRRGTLGLPLGHGPWPARAEDAGTAGGSGLLTALRDPLAGISATLGTRARIQKEDA